MGAVYRHAQDPTTLKHDRAKKQLYLSQPMLAGLALKNRFGPSEYEPEILCTFLCKIQAAGLATASRHKVLSMDLSSSIGAFGFRRISDLVWMTPCVGPNFLFSEHTCSRDDEVSLSIGSHLPTEFPCLDVDCNSCRILLFISRSRDVLVKTFVSETCIQQEIRMLMDICNV